MTPQSKPGADSPGEQNSEDRAAVEDLLHQAVHDLRGSLGQVSALSALLARRHKSSLDADGQTLCSYVETAAKNALAVVNSLDAYDRACAPLERQTVDVNGLVDSACYVLQTSIERSGASVTRDDLVSVYGDPTRLIWVFQELVENALKFRGAGEPRIHFSSEQREGQAIVSVADNACGIPAGKSEYVFRPLKRLHGREHSGTGMGLAICRRIVMMHGGRIWVEARPDGGSIFRIALPTATEA